MAPGPWNNRKDVSESSTILLETPRQEDAAAVEHALEGAGIPYYTEMYPGTPLRIAILVPWLRVDEARSLVAPYLRPHDEAFEDDEDEDEPALPAESIAAVPWAELRAVATVIVVHLSLVYASVDLTRGGIMQESTLREPWRLLTAMLLHVDVRHVLANGISMLVFAVPLIGYLGYLRTGLIYTLAGVGGGVAALALATPGTVTVGSSGAVAGLFGAWIVWTLGRARLAAIGWRARVRTVGIGLLFLPSLISPTGHDGHPISVSSHLGGLATGMLIGAILSRTMRAGRGAG